MRSILKSLPIVIFIVAIFATTNVSAQEKNIELSLQTPIVFEELNPGEVKILTISLTNDGGQSVSIYPDIYKIESVGVNGEIQVGDASPEFSAWVKFEKKQFSLEPGEKKVFGFTLDVPSSARTGGFYGAFGFRTMPNDTSISQIESKISNSVKLNSILLFNVVGGIDIPGEILYWKHIGDRFDRTQRFELLVENLSNEVILPVGAVTIHNMFGDIVDINSLEDHWVLPEDFRQYVLEWHPANAFGKYYANVDLVHNEEVYGSQTVEFWIFSGWGMVFLLGVLGFILICLSFLIVLLVKNIKRK